MPLADAALSVPLQQPVFYYPGYRADFGQGVIRTTIKRQLRALTSTLALVYQNWQVRGVLREIYGEVVWKLTTPCRRRSSVLLRGRAT